MLLLHTAGTTRVGEVRRFQVTYTPSQDRILPLPPALYLRIKNTASLPLRAAYLHGPYTLYVSVRRQEFQPWNSATPGTSARESELRNEDDCPSDDVAATEEEMLALYDPHLKAGASFYAILPIPRQLIEDSMAAFHGARTSPPSSQGRRSYEHGGRCSLDGTRRFDMNRRRRRSVTWVIEIVSQVIFSNTATVGYEVLLGRDEKSLSFGYPFGSGNATPRPSSASSEVTGGAYEHGVLSHAISVKFQDTQELWNTPRFPTWEDQESHGDEEELSNVNPEDQDEAREKRWKARAKRKPKKVHLVILTHGLHSNTSADMLFMKEAIDEEERRATLLRKEKRRKDIAEGKIPPDYDDPEDEQVIVRGYHDNACNTERGIKFLGKRLARFVLHQARPAEHAPPKAAPYNKLQKRKAHHHPHLTDAACSFVDSRERQNPAYKVMSISFIGHSLGGLVQVYAIAYIHAHHPTFFKEIRPVNFVALATPFLGLSNENPLYVRFALDFGLVGRTGQDLGLTWKAPNAFSAAFAAGTGKANVDNSSKPLLRILPTGPAHEVLKMFRNRTVYANVVNDGIVPLRTSCLLFLDWKGLGRVEKARRENGTVGGLVEWGIGQLVTTQGQGSFAWRNTTTTTSTTTGVTSPTFSLSSPMLGIGSFWGRESPNESDGDGDNPISEAPKTGEPTTRELSAIDTSTSTIHSNGSASASLATSPASASAKPSPNPFSSLLTLFRPHAGKREHSPTNKKAGKIYKRSQTASDSSGGNLIAGPPSFPKPASAGTSTSDLTLPPASPSITVSLAPTESRPSLDLEPPPRTTIFEAAGDVLNPPLPSRDFIMTPSSRPRTIFHERIYHSSDIPPPTSSSPSVEEKIARAYHKDMSWRKVLVRLEPDAHNNIAVRRAFANAYGWPVVRHVVETHFGESEAAHTRDDEEMGIERVLIPGEVSAGSGDVPQPSADEVESLESAKWTDSAWNLTDDEEGGDGDVVTAKAVVEKPLVGIQKVDTAGVGLRTTPGEPSEAVRLLERAVHHERPGTSGTVRAAAV